MSKSHIKIKICGITNVGDAEQAVKLGADMLGFILYKDSKRYVDLKVVREITQIIPRNVLKVGVFVNEEKEIIQELAYKKVFDIFQFHGDETPKYCDSLKDISIFKAFRIKDKKDVKQLKKYDVNGYLLDTYKEGEFGGTGLAFDWDIALQAKKYGEPIILSGGLTPENVGQAVKIVNPWAVDVSSGVESSPGKKDYDKMKRFIEEIRKIN